MSLQSHMNVNPIRRKMAERFVKGSRVYPQQRDGSPGLFFEAISDEGSALLGHFKECGGLAGVIELWMAGIAITEPKIYRCDLDYESLDHVQLRLPLADYAQPFPTITVEFPKDYGKVRTCASGHPDFVTIHQFDTSHLLCMVVFDTNIGISQQIETNDPSETVEEILVRKAAAPLQAGSLDMNSEECQVAIKAIRAAMNLMLLVMDPDTRVKHTRDEKYATRLQKSIKNKVNPEHARAELQRIPDFYSLDRTVQLFRDTYEPAERGAPTGRHVRPHWHPGYWRMQPYGPKSSLRKRTLIKAYKVHPELFGQAGITTIYQGKPKKEVL